MMLNQLVHLDMVHMLLMNLHVVHKYQLDMDNKQL
jgi:hypothetical protein